MRVQMQGQNLRLRLQEDEFARLLDGGTIENRTLLPDGRHAAQQVHLARAFAWHAESMNWRITLPATDVHDYARRLPTRDGLEYELNTPEGDVLRLQFDVDVRDSTRKRMPRGHRSG